MSTILSTDRLTLREFNLNDAPFIIKLLNTPGWLQFIGDRNVHSIDDAESYLLQGPMLSYETNGFGLWLVSLKDSGLSIGMCGFLKRQGLENADIGFAFLPDHAGKGYAYEAALAAIKYAQKGLGLDKILAIASANNESSIRLLKKLGLEFERMVKMENEELMLFGTACEN
jgi:[ribosomal protein S5]-alanine N-acetyltransferase